MNNPEMKQRYLTIKDRGIHCFRKPNDSFSFSMIKNQTTYRTDQEKHVLFEELDKKLQRDNIQQFYNCFVHQQLVHPLEKQMKRILYRSYLYILKKELLN